MSTINANQLLAQMQLMAERARGITHTVHSAQNNHFANLFETAVSHVNQLQQNANNIATGYERGENIDVADVMVATQKANLTFSALVEVRNKVVSAYQEIANMSI